MSTIRKALEGMALPAGTEEAITAAETKQRDDTAYIQYLESRLSKATNDPADRPSVYRTDWEKIRDQSEGSGDTRLDAVKEKILIFMSAYSRVFAGQVAEHAGIDFSTAMYYLENLQANSFILVGHSMMGERSSEWSLSPQGRAYLFKHRLLC
jgi:hypothetical protein